MELLIEFVKATPEYQGWGWNLVSFSFLATVAFTFFLQLPGLTNQSRTIWLNHSAKGVEMLTFIAFFTYFIVFFVYAVSIHSGAGVVNVLALIVPQLFILAGIARFKQMRTIDKLAALVGAVIFVLALVLPQKEIFFSIVSVGVFVGLLLQPLEMIRTKTSENIALSFPANFTIVTAVWTIYALAIGDWFLAVASAAFTLEYLLVVILWFVYRPQKT